MSANDEINRKSLEFIVCEIVDSKTRQSVGITEIFGVAKKLGTVVKSCWVLGVVLSLYIGIYVCV